MVLLSSTVAKLYGHFLRYVSSYIQVISNQLKHLFQNYLPDPTFFVFDHGYLGFINPLSNTIEVWHDFSPCNWVATPSPSQGIAAESITRLYGSFDVGHFVPYYTLPFQGLESIRHFIKLIYPTLVAAAHSQAHMWDISTGQYICTLRTEGMLDEHCMSSLVGIELSQDYVLTFDITQVRLFSRYDGNFLFHFSTSTGFMSINPTALLLPPPTSAASLQQKAAVLQQQVVLHKQQECNHTGREIVQGMGNLCSSLYFLIWCSRNIIVWNNTCRHNWEQQIFYHQ